MIRKNKKFEPGAFSVNSSHYYPANSPELVGPGSFFNVRDHSLSDNWVTRGIKRLFRCAFFIGCAVAQLSLQNPVSAQESQLSFSFPQLADAIYLAEGGQKASRPYGIFYPGCNWNNPSYCRQICLNTLQNNYKRWLASNQSKPYLEFLRDRYAPLELHPLNRNWLRLVTHFLEKASRKPSISHQDSLRTKISHA